MKAEGTTKSKPSSRRKYAILSGFIIFALIIFILVDYVFVIRQSKVLAPEDDSVVNTSTGTINTNENNESPIDKYKTKEELEKEKSVATPDPATNYYNEGLKSFDAENYSDAIQSFELAIAANSKIDSYYNKKSQAEMNLGQKEKAIQTTKDGLAVLPDSELLKTRLDILQKDELGNQDGIKE